MDSDSNSNSVGTGVGHRGDNLSPEELQFIRDRTSVGRNDPNVSIFEGRGEYDTLTNMTNEDWEQLGRDIANNTHLTDLTLHCLSLNDVRMSSLFKGLNRSASIKNLDFSCNRLLTGAGLGSMEQFLQNSNHLRYLTLGCTPIKSEGFNYLMRALRDSPIEILLCYKCGITSIEIDDDQCPKMLKQLYLNINSIDEGGCNELSKLLLRGRNSTLCHLSLNSNKIGDEGIATLVDALRDNISLEQLRLDYIDMSTTGQLKILKLVCDVSSVKATLQSNHNLKIISCDHRSNSPLPGEIHKQIDMAVEVNSNSPNKESAAREKLVKFQLNSTTRAQLAELQGVSHSLYSEINPLHLPEVLSLVCQYHGQSELYAALKLSIIDLISVVNKRQCIKDKMAYHAAKWEELRVELAQLEAAEGSLLCDENDAVKKRRLR